MKRFVSIVLAALLLIAAIGCVKRNAQLPKEGTYLIDVTLEGGSGKAKIQSPAELVVFPDGAASVVVVWSSDKYDYMLVGGERFEPAIKDGHSTFIIPVKSIDEPLNVTADTTAMSTPHEIEYTIVFDAASLKPAA